jgi:hypothetical protein
MATKGLTINDINSEESDSSPDYEPGQSDNESNDNSSDSEDSDDSNQTDNMSSDEEVEDKPVKKVEDKPVKKVEDKPVKKVEDKPVKKVEDKPVKKVEDKPDDLIFENTEQDEDGLDDFEVPSEEMLTISKDLPEKKTGVLHNHPPSLISRKSFPFCFWYINQADEKEQEELIQITKNVIDKLFKIENIEVYLIEGIKEKDRLRVICPDVYVDVISAKDIRSLILRDLGYKTFSNIIPVLIYEVSVLPTIFLPRLWDMGLKKWESYQHYSCLNKKDLKTEQLEKFMITWSQENDKELTELSDDYVAFLTLRKSENGDTQTYVLEDEELVTVSIGDSEISDEIKKEVGNNLDKCVEWFKKYHPDSGIRMIKRLGNDVFLLDFTKSKQKCRLCNLVHLSNRQYLTYSVKSEKAFYHCHDSDASNKKHVISFKKQKRGSSIVSAV